MANTPIDDASLSKTLGVSEDGFIQCVVNEFGDVNIDGEKNGSSLEKVSEMLPFEDEDIQFLEQTLWEDAPTKN